jgi:isoquinoline 1-oxidoreductase beta subunit
MAAAAEVWAGPRSELTVKDGIITHIPTGRKLRYGQVAEKAAAIKLPEEPKIKTPDQFTLMNKPTQFLETPLRVDGSATYGIVEFSGPDIEAGVAVVADSYWHAKTALDLLPIEWDPGRIPTSTGAL